MTVEGKRPRGDFATIAHQLQYCTCRLQVRYKHGGSGIGTGFFFNFTLPDGQCIPTLVTNKHVVCDACEVSFSLHLADESGHPRGRIKTIKLDGSQHPWFFHPENHTDICVLPMLPYLNILGEKVYRISIGEDICRSDDKLSELFAIEDVIMVGYPIGLCDEINNFPIFRRGITATNPAHDFQGKGEGAIDIAAFPGSSGSPIFIYNCGAYATKSSITFGNRAIFLGILYAGPVERYGRTVISNVPVTQEAKKGAQRMIHLGYYVKAKKLLEMKDVLLEAKVRCDFSIK